MSNKKLPPAKSIEQSASPKDDARLAEMTKYGITHKSVDYFQLGEFSYTNLNDAIAQAKRQLHI